MPLSNYLMWSRSIADELLDLLTEHERDRISAILLEDCKSRSWKDVRQSDLDDAVRFLTATPAKRKERWDRMHPDDRLILWLRSRQLGLQSANAIQIAERVAHIEGMNYRNALRDVARSAIRFELHPPIAALLDQSDE